MRLMQESSCSSAQEVSSCSSCRRAQNKRSAHAAHAEEFNIRGQLMQKSSARPDELGHSSSSQPLLSKNAITWAVDVRFG